MTRDRLSRFAWALGTVAVAYVLQLALQTTPLHAPLLPFLVAVAVTAVYAGAIPSIVAAALSLILLNATVLNGPNLPAPRLFLTGAFLVISALLSWLITARLRSDAARVQAQTWFQAAQDVSPEGFCILLPVRDARGRVVDLQWLYANPALERLLNSGGLAQRRLLETMPSLLRQRLVLRKGLRILRSGQAQQIEFHHDEEGTRRWLRLSIAKLRDGLAVAVTDVTERRGSAEKLRLSEARLRAFQETSLDGFMVFKTVREGGRIVDLEYTYVNPAAECITNQGPLAGRRLLDVHPALAGPEGMFQRYVRVVETGEPHDVEFYYEGEGVRGWFRNMSVKLNDGIAMSFTDITARKQAEESLRHREAQLSSVIENLAEGLVVSDLHGNVYHWNRAALDMHGFASLDECRRRLHEFVEIFELSTLDGRVISVQEWPLARILRGEHLKNLELHIRRVQSDWERIYSYGGALVRDADGAPLMALLTITDITDRKHAEEALRRSGDALAKAGTMAHFGTWDLDVRASNSFNDGVLHWSDEVYRIFGYEPGGVEISNALFFQHVHPEDVKRVRHALASAVAEKRSYSVEHRIIRPDGVERTVMEYAEVVFDDSGRPVRMLGAVQDVTERKQAEEALRTFAQRLEERVAERTEELARSYEALRQSERLAAIGQMAAAFSHESRNAIQNTTAALEMLRRSSELPRQRRYAEMGLQSLGELKRMHEDVRDYAAPLRLERSKQRLDDLWRAAWDELVTDRYGRDARLTEHLDEADTVIEVDALRMKQVFRNLLENALAACSDPVLIEISVSDVQLGVCPSICVRMRDNGPGVEPGLADRIFEAFFTTKIKGTGLGLAIVRRIVEAHGGRIELGPDPDRGLEFRLMIPREAPTAECVEETP